MAKQMVMARIKRMGKQWASCGVPVRPPEDRIHEANIKRLCPKLVPGQVIKVPSDHNLLNQDCVEIVRRVENDEFMRPWVFKSADEATLANPTKSRLGAAQIAMGLNMAAGAQDKGRKALEARLEAQDAAEDADDDDFYEAPRTRRAREPENARSRAPRGPVQPVEDEDDGYVPNAQNRLTASEHEDIVRRDAELNDEDPEEAVEQVKTARRGRKPRG